MHFLTFNSKVKTFFRASHLSFLFSSQEMKDRLGLIVGEIEAGNSNKKLLEELHELLFKMVRVYLISKSAASTYYNNIKKEFFSL